jgi:hypothetical protein
MKRINNPSKTNSNSISTNDMSLLGPRVTGSGRVDS